MSLDQFRREFSDIYNTTNNFQRHHRGKRHVASKLPATKFETLDDNQPSLPEKLDDPANKSKPKETKVVVEQDVSVEVDESKDEKEEIDEHDDSGKEGQTEIPHQRPHEVPNFPEHIHEDTEDEEEYIPPTSDNDNDDDDNNVGREPYIPPSEMRYVDNALIRQPTAVLLYGDQQLPVDEEIKVGMIFHKKEDCLQAIKSYHIKRSIDFKPKKSDQDRYVIECNQAPQCQFSLRASYSKVNKYWKIVRISNTHTCVSSALTQDHKKLDSNMICDNILSFVEDNVTIEVKALVAHIRDLFNYTISYKKAWIAKNKAIVKIYGDWEDSYNDLPQWLMVMKKWLPGTIIKLQTSPTALDNQVFFQRLFWTFKPCIDGFAFCKPIVQVDGTWLYGKYKGTLLLAVAQDGNNNIFPVAFAIVEGETKEAWNFFMKNLRRYVTPQEGICVISDRHASIKSAYENPSNGWQNPPTSHVYCLRHIGQNFVRETKQSKLRPFVSSMGKYF
ncbi:unnamed protein product [Trifolium pratense]|uniref:Uncharacterized protein n=1 Tax=Trifolium pratense TaxID=57577 RepID=A0ACB0I7N5_TRIPR|nr:unnamed protein product [Trifolium pratense]